MNLKWKKYPEERPDKAGWYLVCRNLPWYKRNMNNVNFMFMDRFITHGSEYGYFYSNDVTHFIDIPTPDNEPDELPSLILDNEKTAIKNLQADGVSVVMRPTVRAIDMDFPLMKYYINHINLTD